MIFNSYSFILAFLPAFLLAFFVFRMAFKTVEPTLALIIAASALFYAFGKAASLTYLLTSIMVTYGIGLQVSRTQSAKWRRWLFVGGLVVSIGPLVFYKYSTAFEAILPAPAGGWVMPLAISFVGFQQIIFLVEMRGGKIPCPPILEYLSAILFFPKLIAGPLASVSGVAEQMRVRMIERDVMEDISFGLSYFSLGLFKKVAISDQLSPSTTPVFAAIESGHNLPFLDAWVGLVTFFVMLYFDFSGYSDMAIGISRMCGISLPFNFNSPLKATSLVDFWGRWHITLMKFLLGNIYNPLALWRTRTAVAAKRGDWRLFAEAAVFPAMVTMLVTGLWHGGGWNFVIFGFMHGIGLSVNQAWRIFRLPRLYPTIGWTFTFLFVLVSLILFRMPDPTSAWLFAKSLANVAEIRIPAQIASNLEVWLGVSVVSAPAGHLFSFFVGGAPAVIWTLSALIAALALPNTQQIMGDERLPMRFKHLRWSPDWVWAITMAMCMLAALVLLAANYKTFVYFGF